MHLLRGDCLEVLKTLEDNSVDSLVTDPPAGISFMGKSWDSDKGGRDEWISWMAEVMRECHRVLKPGAHGLVWSLPRTSHWTATALEDAGFEVRDCITHLFGSGFPKSLDISKAIDKAAGAEREIVGRYKSPEAPTRSNTISSDSIYRPGRSEIMVADAFITAPATDSAKQWQGWGTALKPAAEFWWLVRKPLSEKTVAANVLKWGTGGINIDGSRIGTETITQHKRDFSAGHGNKLGACTPQPVLGITSQTTGRFPANLVLSHSPYCTEDACDMFECAIALLDEQSGISKSTGGRTVKRGGKYQEGKVSAPGVFTNDDPGFGDTGGASRFFYCAKISSSERNAGCEALPQKDVYVDHVSPTPMRDHREHVKRGNHHPTVKPKKLMGYLIKLITPPSGTVLDPFMGSGSTGLAAKENGFEFIGIEREAEYFEIAKARIEAHAN